MKRKNVLITIIEVLLLLPAWGISQTPGFDIVKYGAVADGKTNNAAAINKAIEAAAQAGGGTVVVPAGDFASGPITILSNVTLYLESGSMIRGSTRIEDYYVPAGEAPPAPAGETRTERPVKGLISANNANDVAITGRGTIEGSGITFMNTSRVLDLKYAQTDFGDWIPSRVRQGDDFLNPKFSTHDDPFVPNSRPGKMIEFNHCTNVLVSGVTIQNSPNWTLVFENSRTWMFWESRSTAWEANGESPMVTE